VIIKPAEKDHYDPDNKVNDPELNQTLINFLESLEATLDNNPDHHHLLPAYQDRP
jgi:hypothetical protein